MNEGILASGQPIKVSLGSNSLFNVQTKTLIGSRFDYRVSDDINIGGTVLNLTERPLTRKINIGDEPISNTVVGIDGSFETDAPFITQAADLLPFYSTKEKSTLTVTAEAARLFPGNSRAITKDGIAYIDDFEGSQTVYDIRTANAWFLASTPQGQDDLFPEGNLNNDRAYNYNRAKLAWYTIDPLFFRNDNRTPSHIRNSASQSNNYSREILETEVFPNKDPEPGLINNLPTLDLAFYPREVGPYNYETSAYSTGGVNISQGLNRDGSLISPASRWGGIMRQIQNSDFEASNVEFIQFWIMDPFNEQDGNPNHSGGELYFNIGSVSEDILKDSRKSFENGYSIDGSTDNTAATIWGRIPTVQSVVNAFDNNPSSRVNQDLGLDGLNDDNERAFFQGYLDSLAAILDPAALAAFSTDPSKDNYHYYRGGDYDSQQLSIIERYKMFNGHQGNSPTAEQSPESYPTAATTLPDVEDVNRNFNLDRTEAYYQYRIPLSPDLLQPSNVGSNYITDVVRATKTVNGETKIVNWYQFKIPIRNPEKVIGNIRDFKSIRFMRMFLRGFSEDVIVRFARLGLVRGEWRVYQGEDIPSGDTHGNEPGSTSFNVGAVNVEENSNRVPINYTIPPDIDREIDFGTTNLRQLNEQSLVLDVCNLQDGYSKFAFRYLDLDIRQYKRLKMYAHAEAGSPTENLNDGDVSIVLRLGTDFENNYYEYEVPLKVTQPGQNSPELVWPASNEIDLVLDKLIDVKQNRNRQTVSASTGVTVNSVYESMDGDNIIRVRGNPNLSEVRVVMIGVRNRRAGEGNPNDDGLPKCAEVWANELRLSDFNNDGGWAAQARVNAQVADLGTINLSGSMSTPGWGSLEQKLNERQRETRQQYDFSTSLDIAKFLPEQTRVSVPMYYSQSEAIIRPEYNPLDPDVKLEELYRSDELTNDYKDSIRKITDDYTRRRSINFTNVRKLPGPNKKKSNFYDVENLNFTYAYTEIYKRDINTKFDRMKTYKGAVNYAYSGKAKHIEPLKEVKLFKERKAFALLKEINFNPVPNQVSVQNVFDRMYHERQARNITVNSASSFVFESPPFYQKAFTWSRIYTFRHNFTKSITFNFNASNMALIGEPQGKVDRNDSESYDQFKKVVWGNIREFGENTNYNHNFDINYIIPIHKFPGLDFVSANARYSATYAWDLVGNPDDTTSLGATIRNSNTKAIQAQLNMDGLYNKFKYVRDLKDPTIDNRYIYKDKDAKEKKKEEKEKKKQEKEEEKQRKKAEKEAEKNAEEGAGEAGEEGKESSEEVEYVPEEASKNNEEEAAPNRGREQKSEEEDADTTEVKKFILQRYVMDNLIWSIMSLKTISVSYNETNGTILPNYGMHSNVLGMTPGWDAPGFGFVSGLQEPNDRFLRRANANDWLVDGVFVSGDFSRTYSKQYSIRATLRPIEGLRIQLTANKNQSQTTDKFFFYDDTLATYNFEAPPIVSGTFSMSTISIATAFEEMDETTFESPSFTKLQDEENRRIISQRLGNQNINSGDSTINEFAEGYGPTSQEVLLYSFLATYTDKSYNSIRIDDITKHIPLPNWNITYDGLSKIEFFKRFFSTVTLNHNYRSSFSVGSYTRNPRYGEEGGDPSVKDASRNFINEKQMTTATISEQFSPLINVDFTWKNGLLTRLELRRDRNLSMSFTNNQVTEVQGREYILGLGYRLTNLKLPFRVGKLERSSDLDLRADFSIRDNQTVIRRIVENRNELTAGQRIFTIKITADYRLSTKLNIQLYYDRVANTPLISTTFPTANTNAGIRLRFTLSQ